MKKACFCLAVLILLAAGGCGAGGASASTPAQTAGSSAAQPDPATVSATSEAEFVPDVIMLTLYEGGEYVSEIVLEEADMQVAMDAIMEATLHSAAWPAVDMAEQQDYIQVHVEYANDEVSEYYAFGLEGGYCLQGGIDGMYTAISEETYNALHALAAQ
jgi:hypothetical protein